VATGLSVAELEPLGEFLSIPEEAQGRAWDNEILAAARLTGPYVNPRRRAQLLRTVVQLPHRTTPEVDHLAEEAHSVCDPETREYEQGASLAGWLRQRLGFTLDAQVDPGSILNRWRVEVVELHTDPALEAIGVWGPHHGPAVLLNTRGRLTRSPSARRATLAHEICHLLVDRRAALPLAEAMGGLSPVAPEKRARAFAAEFLAPKTPVAAILAGKPNAMAALRAVCAQFRVSTQIAAWQILNGPGSPSLTVEESNSLQQIAKRQTAYR
jgi:hypothetical protein